MSNESTNAKSFNSMFFFQWTYMFNHYNLAYTHHALKYLLFTAPYAKKKKKKNFNYLDFLSQAHILDSANLKV